MEYKSLTKRPFYLETWVIAIMFALWFFIIPGIMGIGLLILHYRFEFQRKKKYPMIDTAEAYSENIKTQADKILADANAKANAMLDNCEGEVSELKKQKADLTKQNKELEREYSALTEKVFDEYTIISIDDSITSEEYKSKYSLLVLQEKELLKSDKAVIKKSNTISKRVIDNDIKQLVRCFNSETSSALSSITVKNISMVKNKIIKTFETLNKLFNTDEVEITKDFLDIKLQEADLLYSYEYQKEQEKLQQKAIREQMVEEEKVRHEIEREKVKIEKEEQQFKNEISKLMSYLQKSSDIEKQLYVDKIRELEEKLKEVEKTKEDVLNREQNTRAGYVYIISNIGSFGENIYKIGMTRRLVPMERIDELSSASVPFEFDVHAMIFSQDAPALENALHKHFYNCRVNKVNPRKEFFRVSLNEIEQVVKQNFNGTVTFTKVAEAYQYRESLRLTETA